MADYIDLSSVPWYSYLESIKTVVIGNGVTGIGSNAFRDCTGLTSVTIPAGVTEIGDNAFANCTTLNDFNVVEGSYAYRWLITNGLLGDYVAYGTCGDADLDVIWTLDSAGTLTITGEGKIAVYNGYFSDIPWYSHRASINTVVIGNGVTGIGSNAFRDCTGLTSVTIPAGVTEIGDNAFANCTTLNDFNVVEGSYAYRWLITNGLLGNYTAYGTCGDADPGLFWTLDSAGTLKIMGEGAMPDYTTSKEYTWYGNSISAVVIGNGVTHIGRSAFRDYSSLSSVTLPDSLKSIGDLAFLSCSALSSITLPNGLQSIGRSAFSVCSMSSITLPASVTSIGNSAFESCKSLSSITLPNGLQSIGTKAFMNCTSLTSLEIPASMSGIGESAFSGCKNLRSVTLPEGLQSIGASAFYGCKELNSINIPESVQSIGASAFYGCYSLSSFHIPSGLKIIDNGVFYNCSGLSSITLPKDLQSIGNSAFEACYGLSSITIPDSVTSIGDAAFAGCTGLSSITIPSGVPSIGASTFASCYGLSSITIPDSVTSIGASAFYRCYALTDIDIPSGVTSIGDSAFYECFGLTDIGRPSGVTSIGDSAFYKCYNLRGVSIPKSEESTEEYAFIGDYAFLGCTSLRSVTIPETVESIGEKAFCNCSSLRSITLPENVRSIGVQAFDGCTKMTYVLFRGEWCEIGSYAFPYYNKGFTIYCHEGTDMDAWAGQNGYARAYIGAMEENKPVFVDLPEDMRLALGKSFTVTPAIFPSDVGTVNWTSSDPLIVSVENGVLTAHDIGEATITATCNGVSAAMIVTAYVPIESFELSATELWLIVGESAQLDTIDIQPENATGSFYWVSQRHPQVAVDDSGMITAQAVVDATVLVTSDSGVERSCEVHVRKPVTAIALDKDTYHLNLGADAQITANVSTDGDEQIYVNHFVSFTSSDEAVVTVDAAGNMHPVSIGTATITVEAASGVTDTCSVEVSCTHTEATDAAVPATCTATGLTEGKHCSVCGEVLVAQQTVPATGHTPVSDPAVPATHVTTGRTEGSHCNVCNAVLAAQQEVPAVVLEYELVLPASLKTIEEEAFAGGSMACVVLPDGCEAIGAGAFKNCAQLRFVEIPASVTSIDGSAFTGCGEGLIIVTTSVSEARRFAQANNITCVTVD